MKKATGIFALLLITSLFLPILAQPNLGQETQDIRLLRFPDIYKDRVVFTYGGDIWLVPSKGGVARRLTSDPGYEYLAKFSPDGKHIAFTGNYDGNPDVYVIPTEGGEPTRLTYHPAVDGVIDWYPDGKHILFRSGRTSHSNRFEKLFSISIDGGFPEELPLPQAGLASFSPDATQIAYNRIFREDRTWKRYQGGMAQDIWLYNFEANSIEQLTNWTGTDNFPMWYGKGVFFTSDREHTLNIYYFDLKTNSVRKVTNYTKYDVKWPSLGQSAIVYENGGYLYRLDLPTGKLNKIPIKLYSDNYQIRPSIKNVKEFIQEFDLSPSGKRAVFQARGDLFTVPAEKGPTRDLTKTPGVREIFPAWSPNGHWIAYFSDKTGEYELYIKSQDGTGEEIRITKDGDCYRFPPVWSPDSKKLLYSDKNLKLFYVDLEKKKPVMIDKSEVTEIREYGWSPDSKWVTYVKCSPNYFGSVYLHSLDKKKAYKITEDTFDDFNPTFDPEGKYLYFLSRRSYNPTFSEFESSYVYLNTTNLCLLTLQADEPSPFAPQSDEEIVRGEKGGGLNWPWKKKAGEVKIDLEGITQRVVKVPLEPGNYRSLKSAKDKLFYLAMPPLAEYYTYYLGKLHEYDIDQGKDRVVLSQIYDYEVSKEGNKVLYAAPGTWGIVDAATPHQIGEGQLNLEGLEMRVDPKAEWQQMFNEAWRLERDFFYDPNMHGIDWNAMKEKYGQLLPYAAHREDLNYLIGEMIGELCCSHTYVGGGDMPGVEWASVGLMGADLEPGKEGYYQFKKIYEGENWNERRRAPLTEPGAQVKEGEYLISVEGKEVRYPDNPYKYFINSAGKQVRIEVGPRPTPKKTREIIIRPIASDNELRYLDWVKTNREKVEEATNGKVGYIHVPDTSISGLNEFSKAFFAQIDKEGLIIDVRFNSGGMIPEMFIEHLRRELISFFVPREGNVWRTPQVALHGPMVCIINEYAGSGGDAFPYYFHTYGLGPLIGKRTWGGLVGIAHGLIPLMDGGFVTCPEFAFMSLEGEWAVENHGVDPDIEVDNKPDSVIRGRDPQLEKAIEVILEEIEELEALPSRPPYPIKNESYQEKDFL